MLHDVNSRPIAGVKRTVGGMREVTLDVKAGSEL